MGNEILELKTCTCGGKPRLTYYISQLGEWYFFVLCDKCYSSSNQYRFSMVDEIYNPSDRAIEDWNRAICKKHNLITEFRTKKKLETLKCVEKEAQE